MKLYTFEIAGQRRIGAEWNDQLIDLTVAHQALLAAQGPKSSPVRAIPTEMLSLVRLGPLALQAAGEAVQYVQKRPAVPVGEQLVYPFNAVQILAPIPRPGKILCAGMNYRSQQEENPEAKIPSEPFFFAKLPSTVIGPGQPIIQPSPSSQLDYEVELAVIIGKRMKNTPEDQVMNAIFGYTVLHDVSARDVQFRDQQITLGKNFDSFCPMGPCIVTTEQFRTPEHVRLRASLNGQLMQDGSTADWIFPLPRLLGFLSRVMTLEPGDIVSTGTPAGAGMFKKPPLFMKPGDVAVLEIEGIGRLENPVAAVT